MHSRAEKLRYPIAAVKAFAGISDLLFALLVLLASQRAIDRLLARVVDAYRSISPQTALLLQHELAKLEGHKTGLALLLIALGLAEIIGAIGFALRKRWGFYALAGILAGFLPYEALEIIRHTALFPLASAAVDVALLAILWRYRRHFRHENPIAETG